MTSTMPLSCACGTVRLDVGGKPIISVECCCASCRAAAERLEGLPAAIPVRTPHDTVRYELYRKDRVRFVSGMEQMREFRLKPHSSTRRIVAACCNTPLFTEFQGGHWLSLYGALWPAHTLPPLEVRTMVRDLPDGSFLPDDVPNLQTQRGSFFAKLLWAWIAMGFRAPKVPVAGELRI